MSNYTIDTFDWKFYISNYPDLRNAGILTKKNAWKHWRLWGSKENRTSRKKKMDTNYTPITISPSVHSNLPSEHLNLPPKNQHASDLQITFLTSFYQCDKFIYNWLEVFKNLKNFDKHKLIIWNVFDSNKPETNKLIETFSENNNLNVKLLKIYKKDDKGLYYAWNKMIDMSDTDLVCNFNADDKLHPEFINVHINEFSNDNKLNLLSSPLYVSGNIEDNFDNCKDLYITNNKDKIFVERNHEDPIPSMDDIFKKVIKFDDFEYKAVYQPFDSPEHVFSIYSFFNIKNNDILDMDSYDLRCFVGCCPVFKKALVYKYGKFDYLNYNEIADIEAWIRYFINEGNFKVLKVPYVIYYNSKNSLFHKNENKLRNIKRKIIKKYHPIFKFINTNISVIIPFKNRYTELKKWIEVFNHTYAVYFDYEILIMNQINKLPFRKTCLINIGVLNSKNDKIVMSDVDLQHVKINKDLIRYDNNKLFGIQPNHPVLGGGCISFNKNTFLTCDGYNNVFSGWGSEDHDFRYRTFFNCDYSINRNDCSYRNDVTCIAYNFHRGVDSILSPSQELSNKTNHLLALQNSINYHIIYYMDNMYNFIYIKNKIYFDKKKKVHSNQKKCEGYHDNNDILCSCDQCVSEKALLFFEGEYTENGDLIKGKIYNLLYPYHLLFNGSFKNNIINGNCEAHNPWGGVNKNLLGQWNNGYHSMYSDVFNLNITNIEDLKYFVINNINNIKYSIDNTSGTDKEFKLKDENIKLLNIKLENNKIPYLEYFEIKKGSIQKKIV
jgi:hypothetical protein